MRRSLWHLPPRRLRWALGAGLLLLVAALGTAWVLSSLTAGRRHAALPVGRTGGAPAGAPDRAAIKIFSLNLAHGRGDGFHQLLQGEARARRNLQAVAAVIRREAPDVVALQEADGPSVWSGSFDHVAFLASEAAIPYFTRAENVRGLGLAYGTALISRWPLEEATGVTFEPSPPTLAKGFMVAVLGWPGPAAGSLRRIHVVSVHIDFSRRSVQAAQADELVRHLAASRGSMIVAGDFNGDWEREDSTVRRLARALDLTAYRPEAAGLVTFPLTGRRIDWILVSRDLEFRSFQVLPDVLSDHRAVVAEIAWRAPPPPGADRATPGRRPGARE